MNQAELSKPDGAAANGDDAGRDDVVYRHYPEHLVAGSL